MPPLAELPSGLLYASAFVLGAVIGSFVNVLIYRLPRSQSVVRPRSRCPVCGHTIPAWANIPILSYVALRGRCSACKTRISPRYVVVEAVCGLLFVAVLWHFGPEPRLLVGCALCAALLAVIFIDAEHQIIPNSITFPGIPLGLVCAWLLPTPPALLDAVLGVLLVGGMMWGVAAGYEFLTGRIVLGMGDVKLVAMLGAFLGLQAALSVLVVGSLLGLGQALVMMAFKRAGRYTRIPFGPALALAGILHLFEPDLLFRVIGTQ